MKYNYLIIALLLFLAAGCTEPSGKKSAAEGEETTEETATTSDKATGKALTKSEEPKIGYETYHNDRYGYDVLYPDFLIPQGESESGDGQTFEDGTTQMLVYRDFRMITGELDPIEKAFEDDLSEKQITAKELHDNHYRISGTTDEGKQFTQHTLLADGEYITLLFYYLPDDAARMQPVIEKVAQSLSLQK